MRVSPYSERGMAKRIPIKTDINPPFLVFLRLSFRIKGEVLVQRNVAKVVNELGSKTDSNLVSFHVGLNVPGIVRRFMVNIEMGRFGDCRGHQGADNKAGKQHFHDSRNPGDYSGTRIYPSLLALSLFIPVLKEEKILFKVAKWKGRKKRKSVR